jgi:hypothetical protein
MTFNPSRTDLWPCPPPALMTRLVVERSDRLSYPDDYPVVAAPLF